MEKIMLHRIVRTKNDKLMLIWSKPVSDKSNSAKGYNDFTQWFDELDLFNKLENNDFGKMVDANLGYSEPDFQGKCSLIIKDLIVNSKSIKF